LLLGGLNDIGDGEQHVKVLLRIKQLLQGGQSIGLAEVRTPTTSSSVSGPPDCRS
jgi:hypothetical protein